MGGGWGGDAVGAVALSEAAAEDAGDDGEADAADQEEKTGGDVAGEVGPEEDGDAGVDKDGEDVAEGAAGHGVPPFRRKTAGALSRLCGAVYSKEGWMRQRSLAPPPPPPLNG